MTWLHNHTCLQGDYFALVNDIGYRPEYSIVLGLINNVPNCYQVSFQVTLSYIP